MREHCILCQLRPPIQNSHVIPNFVIRRLKEGSPVGTLIHSNRANKVFQDGWKSDLLCTECEQEISRLEHWVCEEVYDPYLSKGVVQAAYDSRLALFAASLAFRYIPFAYELNSHKKRPENLNLMFENLRVGLLSKSYSGISSHLYVQFLRPVTTLGEFPPGINTYFFEAMDGKCFGHIIPGQGESWVVYIKLPGLFFIVSEVDLRKAFQPPEAVESHKILESGMLDSNSQSGKLQLMVGDIFATRTLEIQDNYNKIPSRRLKKMAAKIASLSSRQQYRANWSFQLDLNLLQQAKDKQTRPKS